MPRQKHPITDAFFEETFPPDVLELIECWSRDNYTIGEIAEKLGMNRGRIDQLRKKYPVLNEALRKGGEYVDYRVENALLKCALGYKAKEVKVTTIIRKGHVVESQKEVLAKDVAPSVTAIQFWLTNRCKGKWRRDPGSFFDQESGDDQIKVTIVRAAKDESKGELDDDINDGVEIGHGD